MSGRDCQSQIAVIGAGPGGIAAAVQLKRFGFNPLVFERGDIGGLLRNAHWVENYPGFPRGISGPDLVAHMKAHLEFLDIPVIHEDVLQVDFLPKQRLFNLITDRLEYCSHYLVLASGTRPKTLELGEELPDRLREKIFYDVYPLLNMKNGRFVIIGSGDAACDYALNLARYPENQVSLAIRSDDVKALPLLRSRCLSTDNIHFLRGHRLLSIAEGKAGDVSLTFDSPAGEVILDCDTLLVAIGREAEKEMVCPRLSDLEEELLMSGALYYVGDVKNGLFRQAAIAVGNGIEAAMRLCQRLKE